MRLVLASASPRRAELLTAAGFAFRRRAGGVDEAPRIGRGAGRLRPARGARQRRPARRPVIRTRHPGRRYDVVVADGRSSASPRELPTPPGCSSCSPAPTHVVQTARRAARRGTRALSDLRDDARPISSADATKKSPGMWQRVSRRQGGRVRDPGRTRRASSTGSKGRGRTSWACPWRRSTGC